MNNMSITNKLGTGFVFGFMLGFMTMQSPTFAQEKLPSTIQGGSIEQRFEEPLSPSSTPAPERPNIDNTTPPENADEVTFLLKEIKISGNTVYDDETINALFANLQGQEISLSDIYRTVDEITLLYRRDGYLLSQAVIPAQRIGDGIIEIVIIEGYVNQLNYAGDINDRRGLIQDMMEKLKTFKPLNVKDLERYLLIASDRSGLEVRAIFPSSDNQDPANEMVISTRAVDVLIEQTQDDFSTVLTVDNRGTKSVGPYQISGLLLANNTMGLLESTQLRYIKVPEAKELDYVSISQNHILTAEGLNINAQYMRSNSEPGTDVFKSLEVESQSESFLLSLSQPLIRTRQESLTVGGRFTLLNYKSKILGTTNAEDKVRSINLFLDYDIADRWGGVSKITLAAERGLPILGASRKGNALASRNDGDPEYSLVSLFATRQQSLIGNFYADFSVKGQRANDKLLSNMRCGVGGNIFGRAYNSSEISGENCASTAIQLNYMANRDRLNDWGLNGFGLDSLESLNLYSYYDIGKIWNIDPSLGTKSHESLASAGLGLNLNFQQYLNARLEVNKPLTRIVDEEGDQDHRFFFNISLNY